MKDRACRKVQDSPKEAGSQGARSAADGENAAASARPSHSTDQKGGLCVQ